jgi:hypothetical protein
MGHLGTASASGQKEPAGRVAGVAAAPQKPDAVAGNIYADLQVKKFLETAASGVPTSPERRSHRLPGGAAGRGLSRHRQLKMPTCEHSPLAAMGVVQ